MAEKRLLIMFLLSLALSLALLSLVLACAKPLPAPEPPRIDPALIEVMVAEESGGDPGAIGRRGEVGLMQILPSTARTLGYHRSELFDPATNLECGTRYLETLLNQFGDLETALAAYNAGPGRWRKGRAYARKVLMAYREATGNDR